VLDQFNGLPVHVLLVHAAVVFVPLLALAAVVYALVPRVRAYVGWVAALLALGAPVATFLAKESGEKFRDRLVADGMGGPALESINAHQGYGDLTFWYVLGLGVVTGLMIFLTARRPGGRALPRAAGLGLALVIIVLAAISSYYVFRTGDSGAAAVWGALG
jgi:uncharacterized membrane protein